MPRFYETTLSITNLHNLSISTHVNRSRINLQDLPKTYWQVVLFRPDRRYCDAITAHIATNPIKFIIRLFGATV